MPGRVAGGCQTFVLVWRQLGAQHQIGHADDAVHGRADFMAHIGQEFAFRIVGPLGLLERGGDLSGLLEHLFAQGEDPDHDNNKQYAHGSEPLQPGDSLLERRVGKQPQITGGPQQEPRFGRMVRRRLPGKFQDAFGGNPASRRIPIHRLAARRSVEYQMHHLGRDRLVTRPI